MSEHCTIEDGSDGCISIAGALNFDTVPGVYRETERLFRTDKPIGSIDLSKLTMIDSAGLTLLLEWEALQHKSNKELKIRNAPPELLSLAKLCEADEVMTLSGRDHPA